MGETAILEKRTWFMHVSRGARRAGAAPAQVEQGAQYRSSDSNSMHHLLASSKASNRLRADSVGSTSRTGEAMRIWRGVAQARREARERWLPRPEQFTAISTVAAGAGVAGGASSAQRLGGM